MKDSKRSKKRGTLMSVRQIGTGQTALALRAPDGCVRVQFDDLRHPQSHGWHLYPRHHFRANRKWNQRIFDRW